VQRYQTAILQQSGLVPTPRHYRHSLNRRTSLFERDIRTEDGLAHNNIRIPTWYGFSVQGDEAAEGPITFPARFFTSWHACQPIINGLEAFHDRLRDNEIPDTDDSSTQDRHDNIPTNSVVFDQDAPFALPTGTGLELIDMNKECTSVSVIEIPALPTGPRIWDPSQSPEFNLAGSADALDRYLGDATSMLTAYPEWSEIGWEHWARFVYGNIFGLIVQWGTSGPSIWVMYFSPPIVSYSP
jgi:hypothetical protein